MTFQEFKISLISMSFAVNDYKIEEINRNINIFIGKTKLKNKERSRFEKINIKEIEKNKEIITEQLELIEKLQQKTENEMLEEFLEFLELDDKDIYRKKIEGIYNIKENKKNNKINNKIILPKINIKDNILKNNKKNEYSKSISVLNYNKKEKEKENNIPILKKINIGKQFLVKDMTDKEKENTPKRNRIIYESEESEEEKDQNLPIIETPGIPLFSKNKKIEN